MGRKFEEGESYYKHKDRVGLLWYEERMVPQRGNLEKMKKVPFQCYTYALMGEKQQGYILKLWGIWTESDVTKWRNRCNIHNLCWTAPRDCSDLPGRNKDTLSQNILFFTLVGLIQRYAWASFFRMTIFSL